MTIFSFAIIYDLCWLRHQLSFLSTLHDSSSTTDSVIDWNQMTFFFLFSKCMCTYILLYKHTKIPLSRSLLFDMIDKQAPTEYINTCKKIYIYVLLIIMVFRWSIHDWLFFLFLFSYIFFFIVFTQQNDVISTSYLM